MSSGAVSTEAVWPALLRRAVQMGIGPESFWRLSLKEWRDLTGAGAPAVIARDRLEDLIRRWPDEDGTV